MQYEALPQPWKLAFEARLIAHDPRLAGCDIGITQLAWDARDCDDPLVCADRTFCSLNKEAAEWVRRCMRQLVRIDPAIDMYGAFDVAVGLWTDCRQVDPRTAANESRPVLAAVFGARPNDEPSEGEWVERFMTRVAQLTVQGQVDLVEAAERGKWAWLNMTTHSPEFVAEELYGDLNP